MKNVLIIGMLVILMVPFSSAFASWHWSSPHEICGTEVIKKGEKCVLGLEENKVTPTKVQTMDDSEKYCKNGFQLIKKITTNTMNCVKESSYEKLIQRGWGVGI